MGNCSQENCFPEGRCRLGNPQKKDCKNWQSETEGITTTNELSEENAYLLPWSGNSMGLEDIAIINERSNNVLFGSIGEANSGKTTFLGLLYLLISNGEQVGNMQFANSYSLLGWEYIANYMRYSGGNKPSFPPHTSSFSGRNIGLLHMGLRNQSDFKDHLFTDVPGEWFTNWAVDANAAHSGSAIWINENSAGFMLFIDCEGLVKNPGRFRRNTIKLINRLLNNVNNRPVAVLWSKADEYGNIKPAILNTVRQQVQKIPNYDEFYVSIYPGKGKMYHKNILKSISWLLENSINGNVDTEMSFSSELSDDYFLSYRGRL